MIDSTNQELYFFATAPGNGGDIFYKKSPLTGPISFAPGRGQPFLDVAPVVNNASGAKDPVTAASGLVILAVADGRKQYVHAEMELAGGTSDTTPPTVTATTPADTATGVNVAGNVTATFSETVVGVDKATFTLADAAGTVVPAAVTYNSTTGVASLDPGADLAPGTRYTATLTGGTSAIRDSANNPLVTAQWNFTTAASGDAVAPTVTTTVPAADATAAGLGANVTATFSETVQGVDGTTFTVQNAATGAQVAGVLSRSGLKWIFNPDVDLTADTRYRVTLTGGPAQIRDAANNPLATVTWTFLTGPAPKVSSRTPGVGQTGVRTGVNVTATFNEAVQNVNGSTFRLAGPSGQTVAATVGRNATTNQWVLDPTASLAPSTQYTVTLVGGPGGIADVAGNPLATLTWQFTTGT
jgi:methionine-rich copper-binding protein CopC